MEAIKTRAETIEAYDQMLDEGNKAGRAVIEGGIAALIGQTREFERAIAVLDIQAVRIEGSESLDDPAKALGKKNDAENAMKLGQLPGLCAGLVIVSLVFWANASPVGGSSREMTLEQGEDHPGGSHIPGCQ